MKLRLLHFSLGILVAAAAATVACSSSSSTTPSSSGTPSITAPLATSPGEGATVPNLSQPVTLIVKNAVATAAGNTYTFEVATDTAFAAKVFSKSGVAEEPGGQTGVVLSNLPAGATYYWHARADGNGTQGPFSTSRVLKIGPATVIDPPRPVTPLAGQTSNGWQPFTIANSTRVGIVGAISYRFEVATSSTFATIVASGTVAETGGVGGQTTFTVPVTQGTPAQTALFWRATAIDSNGFTSQASDVVSFTWSAPRSIAADKAAQQGQVLWPGAVPPGTPGHIEYGTFWNVETIFSAACGQSFITPPMETLRVIDAIDRGMSPPNAIQWVADHGYSTGGAVWYPALQVVGFHFEYMGIRPGSLNVWDLVLRGEC